MSTIIGAPSPGALIDDLKALGDEFHAANAAYRMSAGKDLRWPPFYDDYLRYFGSAVAQITPSATEAMRDAVAKKIAAYRAGLAVHRARMAPAEVATAAAARAPFAKQAEEKVDKIAPQSEGFNTFLRRRPEAIPIAGIGGLAVGGTIVAALWKSHRVLGFLLGGVVLGPVVGGVALAAWAALDKRRSIE